MYRPALAPGALPCTRPCYSTVMSARSDDASSEKMGFNATWSMAVGGMVGGGIFSVLGVVVAVAGSWAWLSFVIAGVIALITGYSYASLAGIYGEGGGAFTFLRKVHRQGFAGSVSWILIVGYVLTLSVYAFTFGHYLGEVINLGPWFARAAGAFIVIALVGVNLLGVGEASFLEVFTVWSKLAVLAGLAAFGLWTFAPQQVHYEQAAPGGVLGALVGGAAIFMGYEGFQLLTYDYDDIRHPRKTLHRAIPTAIITVIAVYVAVALGSASLIGADQIVQHKEVSLALAGDAALGLTGKILVSIAAAFSTASAINATLFATARLSHDIAGDGELPRFFEHRNRSNIPDRAVIIIGAAGMTLAIIGSLGELVEAASLAFLFTFAVVNVLAALKTPHLRWLSWIGAAGASAAAVTLAVRLALTNPVPLIALAVLAAAAIFGRPWLLRHVSTEPE